MAPARPITLTREPRGDDLAQLLRGLVALGAASIQLTYARKPSRRAPGETVSPRLAAFVLRDELARNATRKVRYRLTHEVLAVLLDATDHLYGWLLPALPDDLVVLRADGTFMLETIAHEREAWLRLSEAEEARLRRAWPGFEAHVAPLGRVRG